VSHFSSKWRRDRERKKKKKDFPTTRREIKNIKQKEFLAHAEEYKIRLFL
jgi:hypothetical protein